MFPGELSRERRGRNSSHAAAFAGYAAAIDIQNNDEFIDRARQKTPGFARGSRAPALAGRGMSLDSAASGFPN